MIIKLYLHINISSILNIFIFFMWGENILLLDFSQPWPHVKSSETRWGGTVGKGPRDLCSLYQCNE